MFSMVLVAEDLWEQINDASIKTEKRCQAPRARLDR